MKNLFKLFAVSFVLVSIIGVGYVFSDRTDIYVLNGSGSLWGIDVFRIDSGGDLHLSDSESYSAFQVDSTTGEITLRSGDIKLGGIGTAPSETNYFGNKFPCSLVGNSVVEGDVLVSSNVATGSCKSISSTAAVDVLGVSDGSYDSGDIAYFVDGGYSLINTTGTVAIGDILVSSAVTGGTVEGYAGVDNTPAAGADIGVAMSAGSGDDQVLIKHR